MKEAVMQVRMDASLKEQVENLYRSMGTSFAEAVRIFAKQSVEENAMPFTPKRKVVLGVARGNMIFRLTSTNAMMKSPLCLNEYSP